MLSGKIKELENKSSMVGPNFYSNTQEPEEGSTKSLRLFW